ncbi:MAG: alpha-2-macroglobulin [Sandaracinaceae bacterium]
MNPRTRPSDSDSPVAQGPYRTPPPKPALRRSWWPWALAAGAAVMALAAGWLWPTDEERGRPDFSGVPADLFADLAGWPLAEDPLQPSTPLAPLLVADQPAALAVLSPGEGALRVQRGGAVRVRFNRPMVEGHVVGRPVEASPLVFEPSVEGEARWTSRSTLMFQPAPTVWGSEVHEVALSFASGVASLSGEALHDGLTRTVVLDGTPRLEMGRSGGRVSAGAALPLFFDAPVATSALGQDLIAYEIGGGQRSLDVRFRRPRTQPERGFRIDVLLNRELEPGARVGLALAPRYQSWGGPNTLVASYELAPRPSIEGVSCNEGAAYANQCAFQGSPGRVIDIGPRLGLLASERVAAFTPANVRITPPLREMRLRLAPHGPPQGKLLEIRGEWDPDQVYEVRVTGLRTEGGEPVRALAPLAVRSSGHPAAVRVATGLRSFEANQPTRIPFAAIHPDAGDVLYRPVAEGEELRALVSRGPFVQQGGVSTALAALAPEARANRWGPGQYTWRTDAQPTSMAVVAFRPDASSRAREMRTAFVQATDLGVTARAHPRGILVWVTSLSSGEPVDGAVVQVADAQANVLEEAHTDADGVARVSLTANPLVVTHAIRVVSGDDRAAMLLDPRQAVGPAAMGVSPGNAERSVGPVASVFTDRGAYRPGEHLRAKVVLREVRGSRARPVRGGEYELRLMSPANAAPVARRAVTPGRFGTVDAEFDLPAAASLGAWRVEIARGADTPALGSASLQVAQFRQPTFRVDIGAIDGPVHAGDALAVEAGGTYLFGAPVTRGRMHWSLARTGPAPMPERWRRYRFAPMGAGRVRGTIASGEVALSASEALSIEAPATLSGTVRTQLVLEAEITDGAGHAQASRRRFVAYPAAVEVGLRTGDDWQQLGDEIDVDTIAIDHAGTPVEGQSVRVEMVREGWHSWWEWSSGGTGGAYQLRRDRGEDVAHRCTLTSTDEPVHCRYTPRRSGTYLLRVSTEDAEGRRAVASRRVYVAGPDEHPDRDPPGAPIQVTATRTRWTVGETAELAFESPWEGARALITVERNGVLGVEQREVGAGGQVIRIPVRSDMVPNVFVGVTLVRPRVGDPAPGVDLNAPDLRFGVAAIDVRPSTSALTVGLEVAESARPGTEVPVAVTVRDAEGQPVEGEVALWAVDEGTLRLTGYQVPDPSRGLFRADGARFAWEDLRRGLVSRVETPPMPRAGGDGGEGEVPSRPTDDRERFEPTPLWAPTLVTDAQGRATVSMTLPARPTEYRVMAVAVDDGMRIGRASAQLVAEQPLVVRPAFPTFVTSGDTFEASAFVHNATDAPLEIAVRVVVDGEAQPPVSVSVAGGGEHRVAIPITAPSPGRMALRVEATAGPERAEASDSVRIVPRGRYVRSQVFVAGEGSRELAVGLPEGTPTEVGTAGVTVASHPFVGVIGAVEALEANAWGGVVTAAGVVLGLAAHDAMGIGNGSRATSDEELEVRGRRATRALLAMQGYDGGFGRWSSLTGGMPRETALAVQALHAASERGWLDAHDPRVNVALEALRRQAVGSAFGDYYGAVGMDDNAFALRVLADFERPEPARVTALFEQRERLTPYGLAQLAMAVGEDDPRVDTLVLEACQQVLAERADEAKNPARVRAWHITPRVLGAALEAASRFPAGEAFAGRLAGELLGHRHEARRLPFGTPAQTGRALYSLSRYAELWQWEDEAAPRVLLDGEPLTLTSRSRAGAFFQLPIRAVVGAHTLRVEGADEGPVFAAIDGTWAVPLTEADEVARGRRVALHRVYETADGRALEPGATVAMGTMVRVRLFTYLEGGSPTMVGLYDPLPAGFEAVDASHDSTPRASLAALLGMSADDDTWNARAHHAMRSMGSIAHRAFHPHATSFYFDALPHGLAEFTYAIRASTSGTFTVPPAQIEGYLEADFVARSTVGQLGVTP